MQNGEPTITDVLEAINSFSTRIEKTMATKDDLKILEAKMATKEDLGKLRSDMIDYIGKQNIELKTDLVILMRGEDKKIFSLVELLVEKNILTKADANRITMLEPFPQGV